MGGTDRLEQELDRLANGKGCLMALALLPFTMALALLRRKR